MGSDDEEDDPAGLLDARSNEDSDVLKDDGNFCKEEACMVEYDADPQTLK